MLKRIRATHGIISLKFVLCCIAALPAFAFYCVVFYFPLIVFCAIIIIPLLPIYLLYYAIKHIVNYIKKKHTSKKKQIKETSYILVNQMNDLAANKIHLQRNQQLRIEYGSNMYLYPYWDINSLYTIKEIDMELQLVLHKLTDLIKIHPNKKQNIRKAILCVLFAIFISITSITITNYTYRRPLNYSISYELLSTEKSSSVCTTYTHLFNTTVYKSCGNRYAYMFRGMVLRIKSSISDQNEKNTGKKVTYHYISDDDLEKGFIVTHYITITENGGRYSGNEAQYKVVYRFFGTEN